MVTLVNGGDSLAPSPVCWGRLGWGSHPHWKGSARLFVSAPMLDSPDQAISSMTGAAALPRKNGELVFDEPWEGRAFGLAVALNESGVYNWPDFSERLVEETSADEQQGRYGAYYERWVRALERLTLDRALITPAELDARTHTLRTEDSAGH